MSNNRKWISHFEASHQRSGQASQDFSGLSRISLNGEVKFAKLPGLSKLPRLYHIPINHMLAFAVSPNQKNASVAISDAILRNCDQRELAAILAHEISHIKNGDTFYMRLADTFTRMTSIMSNVGLFLIFLSLPGLLLKNAVKMMHLENATPRSDSTEFAEVKLRGIYAFSSRTRKRVRERTSFYVFKELQQSCC